MVAAVTVVTGSQFGFVTPASSSTGTATTSSTAAGPTLDHDLHHCPLHVDETPSSPRPPPPRDSGRTSASVTALAPWDPRAPHCTRSVPITTPTQSDLDVSATDPAESVRCDTDIPAEPVIKGARIAKRAQIRLLDGSAQLVSNRGDPALLGCAGYRVIGCQIGLRATNPKAEGYGSIYPATASEELARRVGGSSSRMCRETTGCSRQR